MGTSTKTGKHTRSRTGWIIILLLAILLLGAIFRFYNVNWDKGTYHIHPDERHTTMVVSAIQWPDGPGEYFDTSRSPLNPRNAGSVYFYGTLPLFLTKAVAAQADAFLDLFRRPPQAAQVTDQIAGLTIPPSLSSYDQIHLVGRVLSALFDLGSVLLLFFLARRLFDWRVGLIASFLLALTVLNIQGSHYFSVDTFLTFFVLLTIWFTLDVAEGKGWPAFLGLGLAMGLTLAAKVSVFLLVIVVALGAWLRVRQQVFGGRSPRSAFLRATGGLMLAALISIFVFRLAQPYAWAGPNYERYDTVPEPWGQRLRFFEAVPEPIRAVIMPNPQWIADIVSAGAQQTGEADMPWGRQWTERAAWLWPLENILLWALGLPIGIAAILGIALTIINLIRTRRHPRPLSSLLSRQYPGAPSSLLSPPSSSRLGPAHLLLAGHAVRQVGPLLSAHLSLPGHVRRLPGRQRLGLGQGQGSGRQESWPGPWPPSSSSARWPGPGPSSRSTASPSPASRPHVGCTRTSSPAPPSTTVASTARPASSRSPCPRPRTMP